MKGRFLKLRNTLPLSPKIQKYAQSHQDKRTTFVAFLKKTVAFLKNIWPRWKIHSTGDKDVCVIVIKQIRASAKTAQHENVSAPNGQRQIVVTITAAPRSLIPLRDAHTFSWSQIIMLTLYESHTYSCSYLFLLMLTLVHARTFLCSHIVTLYHDHTFSSSRFVHARAGDDDCVSGRGPSRIALFLRQFCCRMKGQLACIFEWGEDIEAAGLP